jgi:chorismate dehydratase
VLQLLTVTSVDGRKGRKRGKFHMSILKDGSRLMAQSSWLSLRAKLNHLKKIRVGAVSYLNTKPLLYGIRNHPVFDRIELIEDYPANIAQMLIDDKVDVGLIPVAATLRLKEWHLITDYCIGSDGPVASVCIFSEVPIEEIRSVYLDYQSRTSVNLARILLREYWKKEVQFIDANGEDFRAKIMGDAAGVVIGDRALEQRLKSRFIYDLGEAWKAHTGLPFVFAAWISNKLLDKQFVLDFNEANGYGITQIDTVRTMIEFPAFDLEQYYKKSISYHLDAGKKNGMQLFLRKLKLTGATSSF